MSAITNNVVKGTTIYTDCWKVYNPLSVNGYVHGVVNHSKWYKDPATGIHTNSIEGTWAAVKDFIPKRYRNKKNIEGYLNLFQLKRNLGDDFVPIFLASFF